MSLVFKRVVSTEDLKNVYSYTLDAFSNSPDFSWSMDGLTKEMKDGWELYSVDHEGEILAAVLMKTDGRDLLSKNTAVKMNYQGSGISHEIKEFIERYARENELNRVYHYCRIDNFRMYSLNESHGYKKTGNTIDEKGQVIEWEKKLA